jgi:hypothetical protein
VRARILWELQMNEDLEATLAHVSRMPQDWQRRAAKAMLPTLYKWETRRAMPQLSDEEFDRQWRAVHEPGLMWRLYRAMHGLGGQARRSWCTAQVWTAAALKEQGKRRRLGA